MTERKYTLRQLEAQLIALRADVETYAAQVRKDPDLTPQGAANRLAGWGKQRRWNETYTTIATGMQAALAGAHTRAGELRSGLTSLPDDPQERLHAELRHQRRAQVLDAAIGKGAGAVGELIAHAHPEDVPLIVETVADRASITSGPEGKALTAAAEHGLRARSEDYARAAKTADMADSVRQIVDAQLEHTRTVLADPSAPAPSEYSLAVQSVDVAGEDVGDLTG